MVTDTRAAAPPEGPHEPFENPPCCVCGGPSRFGSSVSLIKGKAGTWYCGPHWRELQHKRSLETDRRREEAGYS